MDDPPNLRASVAGIVHWILKRDFDHADVEMVIGQYQNEFITEDLLIMVENELIELRDRRRRSRWNKTCPHCGHIYNKSDDARHDCEI